MDLGDTDLLKCEVARVDKQICPTRNGHKLLGCLAEDS